MISAPPPPRPLFLDVPPDPVFAMFHAPADGTEAKTAVLICPPWGWDEVASYSSRRTWAEHLAGNGHPVLRIDFQGTGDSGGLPSEPGRVDAWVRAVVAATEWLAGSTDTGRVAVLGLGLGGLVAGQALAAGAPIHDLVLWAAPPLGRGFLREQRAYARLESSHYGSTGEAETSLADGSLEIGGFLLSAETIASIERVDLRAIEVGGLQRALLLGRDGIPVDDGLQTHLEDAGVDVTRAPGPGWGAMCFHPERYTPPLDVFGRVASWLAHSTGAATTSTATAPPGPRPNVGDHADLVIDGAPIRETSLSCEGPLGGFFGLLAEPAGKPATDLCAVFLNAGAVRRIGPNRMWLEASRRWAAQGIPAFRVDVEGIGDAGGDPGIYADVARFYTPERSAQVTAIVDALEARGVGRRFVLVGLCAGAYSAFNSAADDARVVTALAINPRALVWDRDLLARRDARVVKILLERGSWRRILRGQTDAARVVEIGRAVAARAAGAIRRSADVMRKRPRVDPLADELERILDRLRDARTRVVLAFSGDEPVYDELLASGILARLDRWPNVVLQALPGRDHTLRPLAAQRALRRSFDDELDRLLGRRQP